MKYNNVNGIFVQFLIKKFLLLACVIYIYIYIYIVYIACNIEQS